MSTAPSQVILGISMGHGDSSAALIVDDVLVAAVEEERFVRTKHYALYPRESIRYCLRHAGLTTAQVNTVALARKPRNALGRKLALALRHPKLLTSRTKHDEPIPPLPQLLAEDGLAHATLYSCEHHLAHMLSARPLCPDPEVALLSIDGLGDFVSTGMGCSDGHRATLDERVYFPHSLGFFYTAMTQYLGFPYFGDEFKVMGLSSYGEPRYLEQMQTLVQETEPFGFELNLKAFPILDHPLQFSLQKGQPYIEPFFNAALLEALFGVPPRAPGDPLDAQHRDLAMSTQARFEEIANHLLTQLHRRYPTRSVALSGGCAHNSVWVGKVSAHSPFEEVYVAPASSDAGISVGAAIGAARGAVTPEGGHWALLGPAGADPGAEPVDASAGDIEERSFADEAARVAWMADELAAGRIIGLFNGRMEFGPRALGCRSILADPRAAEMRDRLNERVKHRETFRPFAASVLADHQEEWFEGPFFCPAMEAVFMVKPEKRSEIQAVTHADHSCRIQSVTEATQPFYWRLIEAFRERTGVPMLINTSFNDSEPIVCVEQDAMNCFLGSDLDHLVLGTRAFSKVS